jgi:hypothetical protein
MSSIRCSTTPICCSLPYVNKPKRVFMSMLKAHGAGRSTWTRPVIDNSLLVDRDGARPSPFSPEKSTNLRRPCLFDLFADFFELLPFPGLHSPHALVVGYAWNCRSRGRSSRSLGFSIVFCGIVRFPLVGGRFSY